MTTDSPTRAVCYLRLSRATDRMEDTLDRQREDTARLCRERGYEIVETLEDGGISALGGKRTRPSYERLLDLIRQDAVDVVVVFHSDRLHRGVGQLYSYLELCKAHSVRTEVCQGAGLDPSSSDGKLLAIILGGIAEAESDHKGERVTRAQQQAAEQGRFNRGARFRLLGYTKTGEVIPTEAAWIRTAADRLLNGESLRRITRDLAEAGATTVTGRPMSLRQLGSVLRNPKIAGLSTWTPRQADGKQGRATRANIVGTGDWEPILDRDTWEALNDLLSNPDRYTNKVGNTPQNLLSGIATCGCCDAVLRATTTKGNGTVGQRQRRYVCMNVGDGNRHTSRLVSQLDGYVTAVVLRTVEAMDIGRYLEATDNRDDGAAALLVGKRTELEQRLADLEVQLADASGAAVGVLMRSVQRVADQLDEVTAQLTELSGAGESSVLTSLVGEEDLLAWWESAHIDDRRALVRELVTIAIEPVGRGRTPFNPDLVTIERRPAVVAATD